MKYIIDLFQPTWLIRFLLILIVTNTITNSISQEVVNNKDHAPATIYFINIDHKSVVIDHFHNNRYIGKLIGKKYLKYECPPGNQLFWASWTNKIFVKADLKPGGIYVILEETNANAFLFDAKLTLTPVSENDKKRFSKAKKYIRSWKQMNNSQEELNEMNLQLTKFISKTMEQYENVLQYKHDYVQISPDFTIPLDALK